MPLEAYYGLSPFERSPANTTLEMLLLVAAPELVAWMTEVVKAGGTWN
jgi:hypothetical protein